MTTLQERVERVRALTGWTPGPWDGMGLTVYDTCLDGVASCHTGADARFIAAAPDMHQLVLDLAEENERLRGTGVWVNPDDIGCPRHRRDRRLRRSRKPGDDALTGWDEYTGTLTLDMPQGYNDCPAVYTIEADYYRGKVDAYLGCKLDRWQFGEDWHDRGLAVRLLGLDEVRRQEADAGERWCDDVTNRFGWAS